MRTDKKLWRNRKARKELARRLQSDAVPPTFTVDDVTDSDSSSVSVILDRSRQLHFPALIHYRSANRALNPSGGWECLRRNSFWLRVSV